jgi:hypothetical protein
MSLMTRPAVPEASVAPAIDVEAVGRSNDAGPDSAFARIIARLEEGLTVALIANPLQLRRGDEEAMPVRQWMDEQAFSQVLVGRDDHPSHQIVLRSRLDHAAAAQRLEAFAEPVSPQAMISHDTSIRSLLPMLARRPFYLTLRRNRIEGIVELSDIDKPPTRLVLFAHIAELEARMTALIQRHHADDSWLGLLSPSRQRKIEDLFQHKRSRDFQTSRLNCTQFCDKRDVMLDSPMLRQRLSGGSKTHWNERFMAIQDLRDSIAHAEYLLPDRKDVTRLLGVVATLDDLIGRFAYRE